MSTKNSKSHSKSKINSGVGNVEDTDIPQITWAEVEVIQGGELGQGAYGSVVRGRWKRKGYEPLEVAVKLICIKPSKDADVKNEQQNLANFQKTLAAATKEANNIEKTRSLFLEESCDDAEDVLCKVYAVVSGSLPERLSRPIRSWPRQGTLCVGILLRYEDGGTLKQLIRKKRVTMKERIRIAASICKGIGA